MMQIESSLPFNPKVTLFIPIKNEVNGLAAIMPRIRPEWVDEILIVDGNSTDGSQEYLKKHGYPFVVQQSKGVRGAFWEAYSLAKGEFIIPFSPDNNSVPEDIPLLVNKIRDGYDLVIASRYLDHAHSEDDDLISGFANGLFTKIINLLFRTQFTDALTMYKAYRIKLIYDLKIHKAPGAYSEVLVTWRSARKKMKIAEIPSHEPARLGPGGSRAHPGVFGKYKAAIVLFKFIILDWLFFH